MSIKKYLDIRSGGDSGAGVSGGGGTHGVADEGWDEQRGIHFGEQNAATLHEIGGCGAAFRRGSCEAAGQQAETCRQSCVLRGVQLEVHPLEQLLAGFLKEIGNPEQRPENLGAFILSGVLMKHFCWDLRPTKYKNWPSRTAAGRLSEKNR
jgi:hypothetical protein